METLTYAIEKDLEDVAPSLFRNRVIALITDYRGLAASLGRQRKMSEDRLREALLKEEKRVAAVRKLVLEAEHAGVPMDTAEVRKAVGMKESERGAQPAKKR